MNRRSAALFALALLVEPSLAAEANAPANAACPKPMKAIPRYPPDAARAGKGGVVVVRMRVDVCGRVVEAKVQKSAGRPDLNEAALVAKRASVLSEEERSGAVDDWVEQEVSFGIDDNVNLRSRKPDWPKTHRRPTYLPDKSLEGLGNAMEVSKDVEESVPDTVRPPVISLPHSFLQYEARQGREFWLLINNSAGVRSVAVRYRPVMEGDAPVVRMAVVCDLKPEQCASINKSLMQGLPFARAKN